MHCLSLRKHMLTTAPLWWLVVAHAIWGPTVVDKQNSQNTKQSWVYDWLSQRPAARGSWYQSCQLLGSSPPRRGTENSHFLSSGGHHRYSMNLDLQVSLLFWWCVGGSSVQGEGPWKRVEILRGSRLWYPGPPRYQAYVRFLHKEVESSGVGWQSLTPVLTAGHTRTLGLRQSWTAQGASKFSFHLSHGYDCW